MRDYKAEVCVISPRLRQITQTEALKEQCHISHIFSFPFFLPFYKLLIDSV